MNRKTRLSEVHRWRKSFIDKLEGAPVSEFALMRRREIDGKVIVDIVHGKRRLSRKGAEKLAGVVEQTMDEYFRKHPIPKMKKVST